MPIPMMIIDIAMTVRSTVSHVGNAEGCSSIALRPFIPGTLWTRVGEMMGEASHT
jgi:hypothetical protein